MCLVQPEVILQDKRFKIDLDFFNKLIESHNIESYKIKKIKLKNIRRYWQGKLLKINETHPYLYLQGNVEQYQEYCDNNTKNNNFLTHKDIFDSLIKNIQTNSYDSLYMPIINQKNNTLLDGQHRCCVLYHLYGKDYEIPCLCLKIRDKYAAKSFIENIFSIKKSYKNRHKIITILGMQIKIKCK